MPKSHGHLAFSAKPLAPPPPLLGGAAAASPPSMMKKKKKPADAHSVAAVAAKGYVSSKLESLVKPKVDKLLKRKRKAEGHDTPPLGQASLGAPVVKKHKKSPAASGDGAGAPFMAPDPGDSHSPASGASRPGKLAAASSCTSSSTTLPSATATSSAPASSPSASSSYSNTSAPVGAEAGHVLLLLNLPPKMSELDLQRQFAACAPLQVTLLFDWADAPANQPRRAASLALGSERAVKLAFDVCAGNETGSSGGAKLRVCDARTSSAQGFDGPLASLSSTMRAKLAALEGRALQACGDSVAAARGWLEDMRHLLLCCDAPSAHAALDEFCTLAKSGTPKNPTSVLLATLLRHRRVGGGDLWLGRLNGRALPVAEKEWLHALLRDLDWSAMPADGKLRGPMADNSFKLGLSTKVWGRQNGPYARFAFKEGMGVWDAASVTRKHRQLWEAAAALIAAVDPAYPWTSVQFNRNFRGSRHRDDKDASHQVATAFGDYTGGELRVFGQEGVTDVNTRDRFVRFDGRFEHEVLPYEGTRYSVIYFMLAPPFAVDPSSTEEGRGMK